MPRSFYEWREAYSKWKQNQIQSIPYPTSLESVIYERESNNPFWERRRQNALKNVPEHINLNFEPIEFIKSIAIHEHTKEQEFLKKFSPGNENLSDVERFNILFSSKELYENFDQRLREIINTTQNKQNKSKKSEHQFYTGMAPNLYSIFTTYFYKHMPAALSKFYQDIKNNPDKDINQMFDDALKMALDLTNEDLINITIENSNEYGYGKEWEPIKEMMDKDPLAKELFLQTLKDAIGSVSLEKLKNEIYQQTQESRSHKANQKKILKARHAALQWTTKKQKAQVGGKIAEAGITLIAQYFANQNTSKNYQLLAQNFGKETVMSDVVILMSQNTTINLVPLMEELKNSMQSGSTLEMREVYQRILDFDYRRQQEMKDIYRIFINAKNKGVGHDATNYKKTYNGGIEELPKFLSSNGVNIGSVDEFLSFAYNIGEGAVRHQYSKDFIDFCANALSAIAANIMFDDYFSFTNNEDSVINGSGFEIISDNNIHLYFLSGKYIPASIVYNAMADSLNDARSIARGSIGEPPPIEDDGPEWPQFKTENGKKKNSNADFKQKLYEHWQEEHKRAKTAMDWSVSFTLKIKQLVLNG